MSGNDFRKQSTTQDMFGPKVLILRSRQQNSTLTSHFVLKHNFRRMARHTIKTSFVGTLTIEERHDLSLSLRKVKNETHRGKYIFTISNSFRNRFDKLLGRGKNRKNTITSKRSIPNSSKRNRDFNTDIKTKNLANPFNIIL